MNLFCSLILPFFAFFTASDQEPAFRIDGPVTWVGIDYSQAKFIGAAGFTDPADLPRFLLAWNDFVLTEPDKYDVKKALGVSEVTIDLSYTYRKNEELDTKAMVQEEDHKLSKDEVVTVAKSYDFSKLDGTVAMLLAEAYNKKTVLGSHWLVLIDAENSEVLSAVRYEEKAKGFGLRNYWAHTIYELLQSNEKAIKKGK